MTEFDILWIYIHYVDVTEWFVQILRWHITSAYAYVKLMSTFIKFKPVSELIHMFDFCAWVFI